MHATYSVAKDHNYGSKQTPRKTLVHCSGSASMENSAKVLGTTTNSDSERNKFLSNRNKIKPTFTGRIEVVEREFTSSEQEATENRNTTIEGKSIWVGGNPVRKALWGDLVISRKDKTYQCTGAHCCETCNINL